MKKMFMFGCLAACILLGGCATTQQQQIANQINSTAGAVIAGVVKACGWALPVENAAAILATFGGQAIEQAIASAINSVCAAVAPHASTRARYIPTVNGVRVLGKPNR